MADLGGDWETASQYLEALDAGLDSLPDERVRMDVVQAIREQLAERDSEHPVTAAVLERMAAHRGEFIPEVWFQAMTTRFSELLSPDEYFEWSRQDTRTLVDRPFFRPLMRVLSPTLLLLGTARRWSTLREGTSTLSSGPVAKADGRKTVELVLRHPPGLFSTAFLDALGPAFAVLVEAARGGDPEVERTAATLGESHYRLSWS